MKIPMTIAEVKAGLPIPYVLLRAGVQWEDGHDGRVHAVCPFHNDHEPSLDVFAPNRWNCPPCGDGGDVLDLLQRFAPNITFGGAMEWAERLIDEMRAAEWVDAARPLDRPPFDVGEGSALVVRGLAGRLDSFIRAKGYAFDATFLRDEWGVGQVNDRIIIPYWSYSGDLRTYRTRAVDGSDKPKSAYGTHEPTLYGEWRDTGNPLVVLCEGESDAWSASYALGTAATVLGVPGAGRAPWGHTGLSQRQVVIAFDGDPAGRAGSARWRSYLPNNQVVRVIDLPDGRDLSSYGADELRGILIG